jgi:solute carrier family 25 iron transporter 28/37
MSETSETSTSRTVKYTARASEQSSHRRMFARASSSTARADARGWNPVFSAASVGEEQFYGHMIAGAVAGTTEHTAMFPLDTIKTRMQTATKIGGERLGMFQSASFETTARQAASALLKKEGVRGLYRGVAAVGIGAGPAHAVYFATYEYMKAHLGAGKQGEHHPMTHALAGSCATVIGDAVQTPVDTVKQRLQMAGSPYSGVWDCARGTVRQQGFWALYRSYPTTLAMNVPFTAMHFTAYESAKVALGKCAGFRSAGDALDDETFFTQFTAGGLAGGLAAALTNPLDVVKTRMQTHCDVVECEVNGSVKPDVSSGSGKGVCAVTGDPAACKATSREATRAAVATGNAASGNPFGSASLPAALRRILVEEGASALLRGIGPRVLFHIPAGAISWATYEAGKRVLGVAGAGGAHH